MSVSDPIAAAQRLASTSNAVDAVRSLQQTRLRQARLAAAAHKATLAAATRLEEAARKCDDDRAANAALKKLPEHRSDEDVDRIWRWLRRRKPILRNFFGDKQRVSDSTRAFCRAIQVISVPFDTLVYRQRDKARDVYCVVGGAVELLRHQDADSRDAAAMSGQLPRAPSHSDLTSALAGGAAVGVASRLRPKWGSTGSMGPLVDSAAAAAAGGSSAAAASAAATTSMGARPDETSPAAAGQPIAIMKPGDVFGRPSAWYDAAQREYVPATRPPPRAPMRRSASSSSDNSGRASRRSIVPTDKPSAPAVSPLTGKSTTTVPRLQLSLGATAVQSPESDGGITYGDEEAPRAPMRLDTAVTRNRVHSKRSRRHKAHRTATVLLRVPHDVYITTPVGVSQLEAHAARATSVSRLVVFKHWPKSELQYLAAWMRDRTVSSGDVVYRAGARLRDAQFLVSGCVSINAPVPSDSARTCLLPVEHVFAPNMFGFEDALRQRSSVKRMAGSWHVAADSDDDSDTAEPDVDVDADGVTPAATFGSDGGRGGRDPALPSRRRTFTTTAVALQDSHIACLPIRMWLRLVACTNLVTKGTITRGPATSTGNAAAPAKTETETAAAASIPLPRYKKQTRRRVRMFKADRGVWYDVMRESGKDVHAVAFDFMLPVQVAWVSCGVCGGKSHTSDMCVELLPPSSARESPASRRRRVLDAVRGSTYVTSSQQHQHQHQHQQHHGGQQAIATSRRSRGVSLRNEFATFVGTRPGSTAVSQLYAMGQALMRKTMQEAATTGEDWNVALKVRRKRWAHRAVRGVMRGLAVIRRWLAAWRVRRDSRRMAENQRQRRARAVVAAVVHHAKVVAPAMPESTLARSLWKGGRVGELARAASAAAAASDGSAAAAAASTASSPASVSSRPPSSPVAGDLPTWRLPAGQNQQRRRGTSSLRRQVDVDASSPLPPSVPLSVTTPALPEATGFSAPGNANSDGHARSTTQRRSRTHAVARVKLHPQQGHVSSPRGMKRGSMLFEAMAVKEQGEGASTGAARAFPSSTSTGRRVSGKAVSAAVARAAEAARRRDMLTSAGGDASYMRPTTSSQQHRRTVRRTKSFEPNSTAVAASRRDAGTRRDSMAGSSRRVAAAVGTGSGGTAASSRPRSRARARTLRRRHTWVASTARGSHNAGLGTSLPRIGRPHSRQQRRDSRRSSSSAAATATAAVTGGSGTAVQHSAEPSRVTAGGMPASVPESEPLPTPTADEMDASDTSLAVADGAAALGGATIGDRLVASTSRRMPVLRRRRRPVRRRRKAALPSEAKGSTWRTASAAGEAGSGGAELFKSRRRQRLRQRARQQQVQALRGGRRVSSPSLLGHAPVDRTTMMHVEATATTGVVQRALARAHKLSDSPTAQRVLADPDLLLTTLRAGNTNHDDVGFRPTQRASRGPAVDSDTDAGAGAGADAETSKAVDEAAAAAAEAEAEAARARAHRAQVRRERQELARLWEDAGDPSNNAAGFNRLSNANMHAYLVSSQQPEYGTRLRSDGDGDGDGNTRDGAPLANHTPKSTRRSGTSGRRVRRRPRFTLMNVTRTQQHATARTAEVGEVIALDSRGNATQTSTAASDKVPLVEVKTSPLASIRETHAQAKSAKPALVIGVGASENIDPASPHVALAQS